MDLEKTMAIKKNIYYEDRINGLKDANKQLKKENEQLKEIIKPLFDNMESVLAMRLFIQYTDEQKQIIKDILKES